MEKWLSLGAGSLAGGVARYAAAGAVYGALGTGFPYGTLAVNLIGCFLIGLFDSLAQERFMLGPGARMLLMVGFCGSFTTFSTLLLETSNLLKDGELWRAGANVAVSLVAGLILLRLGAGLARAL